MYARALCVAIPLGCFSTAMHACGAVQSEQVPKDAGIADSTADQYADAGLAESGADGAPIGTAPARWFAILNYPTPPTPPAKRNQLFAARVAAGLAEPAVLISDNVLGQGADPDAFRWSPAGTHVAYISDSLLPERFDLHVQSFVGGAMGDAVTVQSPSSSSVSTYRWSAKGTWLAFVIGDTAPASIYVVAPDGSKPLLVTDQALPIVKQLGPCSPKDHLWGFSSDERLLAFIDTNGALSVFDVISHEVNVVASAPPGEIEYFRWAVEDPILAYDQYSQTEQERRLYAIKFNAGQAEPPVTLTPAHSVDAPWEWAWAPVGKYLVFRGVAGGSPPTSLYVVDGSGAQQPAEISAPVPPVLWRWAPDGNALWMTDVDNLTFYVARGFATSSTTAVSVNAKLTPAMDWTDDDSWPRWWPDSRHLQFLATTGTIQPGLYAADTLSVDGAPTPIFDAWVSHHSVSPDGKWVSFSGENQFLVRVDGPKPETPLPVGVEFTKITSRSKWTSDSSMVAYAAKIAGVWEFLVNDVTSGKPTPGTVIAPAVGSTPIIHGVCGEWQP